METIKTSTSADISTNSWAGKLDSPVPGSLPKDWSESFSGGMITSKDPLKGGIIDTAMVSGKWFIIFNHEKLKALEKFETREDAIDAFISTINDFFQPKINELVGDEYYGDMAGDWLVRWHDGDKFVSEQYRDEACAREKYALLMTHVNSPG